MDERPNVLECLCRERDGEIVRSVKQTELSLSRLKFIWEQVKDFKVLFNDFVEGDFQAFVDHFIVQVDGELSAAGLMWDVDDVGMFFLNEIKPAVSGTAHFLFWDEKFRGRDELCRQMLRYLFEQYEFVRIEVRVPLYASPTLVAVERVGFIQEGRIRSAALYKGKWFDVNVYSVLREDLDKIPSKDLSNWRNRRHVCHKCGDLFDHKNIKESV